MIKDKTAREKESSFYRKCANMLKPLGFVDIYQNHPCDEKRQFGFIKDGVRVQCVLDMAGIDGEYFKVTYDVLDKVSYSVLGTIGRIDKGKIIEAHRFFYEQRKRMTRKPLLTRLKRYLRNLLNG